MYSIDDFSVESVILRLKQLETSIGDIYESLPNTVGCMQSIEDKTNSCGAWCCDEQSPSVWFCEFLNTLTSFIFRMDPNDFSKMIEMCLKKYLLIYKGNGCVFWDSDTKLCKQHKTRPINCYFYGVTPQEDFEPRYERLKVLNNEVKPQCDRISLEDGAVCMSKELIDVSFDKMKKIDGEIGVPEHFLNDDQGGSYRSYSEHILLWLLGEDQMCNLSVIRSSSPILEKKKLVATICENLSTSLVDNGR